MCILHIHIPLIGRLYECCVRRVLLHFHIGIIMIVCTLRSHNYEKILVIYLNTSQYVVLFMHFLVSIHRSYTTIKKKLKG